MEGVSQLKLSNSLIKEITYRGKPYQRRPRKWRDITPTWLMEGRPEESRFMTNQSSRYTDKQGRSINVKLSVNNSKV